jgi:hypothetical protein
MGRSCWETTCPHVAPSSYSGTNPELQPQVCSVRKLLGSYLSSQCTGKESKKGACPRSHKVTQIGGRAYKLNSPLLS